MQRLLSVRNRRGKDIDMRLMRVWLARGWDSSVEKSSRRTSSSSDGCSAASSEIGPLGRLEMREMKALAFSL